MSDYWNLSKHIFGYQVYIQYFHSNDRLTIDYYKLIKVREVRYA